MSYGSRSRDARSISVEIPVLFRDALLRSLVMVAALPGVRNSRAESPHDTCIARIQAAVLLCGDVGELNFVQLVCV